MDNFKNAMATLRSISVGEKSILVFSRQDSVVVTSPTAASISPSDVSKEQSSTRVSTTPHLDLAFEPVSVKLPYSMLYLESPYTSAIKVIPEYENRSLNQPHRRGICHTPAYTGLKWIFPFCVTN